MGYIREKRNSSLVEFYRWDPWRDSEDAESFEDEDFAAFISDAKMTTVYHKVIVRYDESPYYKEWDVSTSSHNPTEDLMKPTQEITVDTYIKDSYDADMLAGRLNFLFRGIRFEFDFTERGMRLIDKNLNSRMRVTKTRAPSSTGSFTNRLMDLIFVEVDHITPKVEGRLADLQYNVGKWTDDTAPAWSSATDAEKEDSGFWCDASGQADTSDPSSKNKSLWW
jgi:hypothetical protein